MKQFLLGIFALSVISNVGSAVVMYGWERPLMRADLQLVEGPTFPRAFSLTINQRDEEKQPTSFTLVEDTGIRCIMAPCPSEMSTEFTIVEISQSIHGSDVVRYQAVEVLKNIPANVRIAPRRLNVTESNMELVAPGGGSFIRRTVWNVEVKTFSMPVQIYSGNPEYLMTIATDFE